MRFFVPIVIFGVILVATLVLVLFQSPGYAYTCNICDRGCEVDQVKAKNLEEAPFICKKSFLWFFGSEYNVAKGYDSGCCGGRAPEGGLCFECSAGCNLDVARAAAGNPAPYICKKSATEQKYVEKYFDLGCCGGPRPEGGSVQFVKTTITNNQETCSDFVKWEMKPRYAPIKEDVSNKCIEADYTKNKVEIKKYDTVTLTCTSTAIPTKASGPHTVLVKWCGKEDTFLYAEKDIAPPVIVINPESGYRAVPEGKWGERPPIYISFTDVKGGSGIDFKTIKITVNGRELTFASSPGISCKKIILSGQAITVCDVDSSVWDLLKDGKHEIFASISDLEGNKAEQRSVLLVGSGAVSEPPTVRIIWPQDGASYSKESKISLVAEATDDIDSKYTLKFDWEFPVGVTTDEAKSKSWAKFPQAGEYTIKLTVTDSSGLKASDSVRIKIEDKLRLLFVPFNWKGTQAEFEQEAERHKEKVLRHTPLSACPAKLEIRTTWPGLKTDKPCDTTGDELIGVAEQAFPDGKHGIVIALGKDIECSGTAGWTTSASTLFNFAGETGTTIHELGHIFGFFEQYLLAQQKAQMKKWGEGNYPNPQFPNPLEARLDCSPYLGEGCCNYDARFGGFCLGNKALTGKGQSFMGGSPSKTDFDENEWNHLKNNIPILKC